MNDSLAVIYRNWAALLAFFLLAPVSARTATLEEVNAEINKANEILRSSASGAAVSAEERAKTLTAAVERLHDVIEMIEKVPNLTADERDKKASDVMAIIFWCKKMTPMSATGGSIAVAKPATPTSAGEGAAAPQQPAPKAEKQVEYDELAFNRAKTYAAAHPGELSENAARFESVAATYPGSAWAEKSLQEAKQLRTKLEALRNAQLMTRLEKLDLDAILAGLEKDSATPDGKTRVQQVKKEIEILQDQFNKFVKFAEGRFEPLNVGFAEVGLNRKGFIKSANKAGLVYTAGKADEPAEAAPLAWSDFGAKAMIRLAQKVWPTPNVEALEQRAIAATVCEEYIAAQSCFARLLNFAPERVKDLNAYFVRAQYGYTNSAEGAARTRFTDAKNLFKKQDFKGGMAALTALQKDLADNSSLAVLLNEVVRFRATSRRQYQINDAGEPITQFEKVVRRVFAGDVQIDETTGKIEASYDFSEAAQFNDWTQTLLNVKKTTPVQDWRPASGKAVCSGQGAILTWRFPLSEFSVTADMTYQDPAKKVLLYACLAKDNANPVWAWCHNSQAQVCSHHTNWYMNAHFTWRPGEVANLRWVYTPGEQYPQALFVNNQIAICGNLPYTSGGIGFAFEAKGTGSVTNVHISGVMDLAAFKALLSAAPGH